MREPAHTGLAGRKFQRAIFTGNIGGVTYEILRHPELLLSETACAWLKDYEYTEEFKIPIPHEERHPCWLEMREEWKRITGGSK